MSSPKPKRRRRKRSGPRPLPLAPEDCPSLETINRLGADLLTMFDQLAERHNVSSSIVAEAANGYFVHLTISSGFTRREYLLRAAQDFDAAVKHPAHKVGP